MEINTVVGMAAGANSKLAEIANQVGTEELETTAQDLTGAINELKEIDAAAAGISDSTVSSVLTWSSNKLNTDIGYPATNMFTNGDFNTTDGWSATNGGTGAVANNEYTLTGNGTSNLPVITGGNTVGLSLSKDEKLYMSAYVTPPTGCTYVRLNFRDSTSGHTIEVFRINNPTANTEVHLDGIITLPSASVYPRAQVTFGFSSAAASNGLAMKVRKVCGVRLTAVFGAGKEPLLERTREIMSKFTNYFFDGTTSQFVRLSEMYDRFEEKVKQIDEIGLLNVRTPTIRPFERASNPVITASMVTDRTSVDGVADPFIVYENGKYYAFFEVLGGVDPATSESADEIGYAWSYDAISWTYGQIVLDKHTFGHRSAYPNVFKYDGEWYMIPDCIGSVKLYKATTFPTVWEFQLDLITGTFVDTNIFQMDGVWYITTTSLPTNILMYYNTSGDFRNTYWTQQAAALISATATEKGIRNAGNPFVGKSEVIMPVQITPEDTDQYGEYTVWYKLTDISPTTCTVTRLGYALTSQRNGDWDNKAMHHITHVEHDNGYIYLVDGFTDPTNNYAIGVYVDGEQFIASSSATTTTSVTANTWTALAITRGAYDTFEMHNRTTQALEIKTAGYYQFNVQIGNADAQFRIKAGTAVVYTSLLCAGSKLIYISEPCTIAVEVYSASGTIDTATTFIDCKKVAS